MISTAAPSANKEGEMAVGDKLNPIEEDGLGLFIGNSVACHPHSADGA